ncbi:thioredoxin family protein [Pseudonocardia broussonetiae]|uniref:thioredoxin family protein n=1 Tax=Pseudonocardia broussonetiae TaxID=2736640 RepID=UPI001F04C44E|nr:thioredoxin family protein [Pseudonocardia broussonetiae]
MTVLVAALVLATAVGLVLRRRDGRLRATADRRGASGGGAAGGWALAGTAPADGDRVLLLQLSSPVCTPCRRTAELIDDLRARQPGVAHAEVDVAERPEVARALGVLRTPTVVAFDRSGAEFVRVSGLPRAAELEAALAPALGAL